MDVLSVFNHLVLPARVPGKPDEDTWRVSDDVLARISNACYKATAHARPAWSVAFQAVQVSLDACYDLNELGRLDRTRMLAHFCSLSPGNVLVLHIAPQNAALLIWIQVRNGNHQVVFEAFEASPTTTAVLAAPRALEWDFPGRSCRLSLEAFQDPSFQLSLATFLEQASMESLNSLSAQITKAGISVAEERDTSDPALITQMLMSILEAVGEARQPNLLRKHVRDDVNMVDAKLPWRRLPFWLVLRIAARRQLGLGLGESEGRFAYKCLIAILLARLLRDSAGPLPPDMPIILRAKLCRRMAKLQMDLKQMQPSSVEDCTALLSSVDLLVQEAVREATTQVNKAWAAFKSKTQRFTPMLPRYADEGSLRLSLPNSGAYLDSLLKFQVPSRAVFASLDLPRPLDTAIQQAQDFTDKAFALAALDSGKNGAADIASYSSGEEKCRELARLIDEVFKRASVLYDGDPVLQSFKVLTIFSLWIQLDAAAIAVCPLLKKYAPVFEPKLLDALQLPNLSDMRRLQEMQIYLDRRISEALRGNIFQVNNHSCLGAKYSAQSSAVQALGESVQAASDYEEQMKEVEWASVCNKYDEHTSEYHCMICQCSFDEYGERDVRGCTKCWHWRARKRLGIHVFEAYLPDTEPARAIALFELGIPAYLATYRDTTWRVLRSLAHPSRIGTPGEAAKLLSATPLGQYMCDRTQKQKITLASRVKCFTDTHYSFIGGKVPMEKVILPLAARFELYDQDSKTWVGELAKQLTLEHLCGVHVPRTLRSTVLPPARHPAPQIAGPSSYEVQANSNQCPAEVSGQEFAAHQELLSGTTRRWIQILVQLGSSSLNFSSQETVKLLSQLAVQAGPRLGGDVLRQAHVSFREPGFVERLLDCVQKRLGSILKNWREHQCMELLITLTLRIFQLAPDATERRRAQGLLDTAREATLSWTVQLGEQVRSTKDAAVVQRASGYCLWAGLLCRRTFAAYVDPAHTVYTLSPEQLAHWVQGSVALQESIRVDIDQLPHMEKHALLRDAMTAFRLVPLLRRSVEAHPAAVGRGIDASWSGAPVAGDAPINGDIISAWDSVASHDRWIVGVITDPKDGNGQRILGHPQVVHYNFVEGHLLVNGKTQGKLPREICDNPDVKTLFGDKHLLTYPFLGGKMTHRLVTREHGQEVHFGLDREKNVVIQSISKQSRLQFVPSRIFAGPDSSFDLPSELVEGCVHWLNLGTRCLEVRRAPDIWRKRPRDWVVDVDNRRALRGKVTLVDPRSAVFASVERILAHFETPEALTVYQPATGRLMVALRRLDLAFGVNKSGRLECEELGAEIDPDQNAGTWYGLASKIVVRDVATQERSVLVPLGIPAWRRFGMHVEVRMKGATEYGRFGIDTLLGRLTCAPEPKLLFVKAVCHALTSFCLPDPLTKRTGTEEALAILASGIVQPWTPINANLKSSFECFEKMLPRRQYYPPKLKRLQQVVWNDHLTTTIQHDGYRDLLRDIIEKSNRLGDFAAVHTAHDSSLSQPATPLDRRGELQRRLYERPFFDVNGTGDNKAGRNNTIRYTPRDRVKTPRAEKVFQAARLVVRRCEGLHMNSTLASILETWDQSSPIGGFQPRSKGVSTASNTPLLDQIEGSIQEKWGYIVQFCQAADVKQHQGTLLFRLGLLAFGPVDMDIVHSLAAFACISSLKQMQPPDRTQFTDFPSRGKPSSKELNKLVMSACSTWRGSHYQERGFREVVDSVGRTVEQHNALCERETEQFSRRLLGQWPAPSDMLSTDDCAQEVLDLGLALEKIAAEWERRRDNDALEGFVNRVQAILDSCQSSLDGARLAKWTGKKNPHLPVSHRDVVPFSARDLVLKPGPLLRPFSMRPARLAASNTGPTAVNAPSVPSTTAETAELRAILNNFTTAGDELRKGYGNDLLQSLQALEDGVGQTPHSSHNDPKAPTAAGLDRCIERLRHVVADDLSQLADAFAANDTRSPWLRLGAMWPCIETPMVVLPLLRSASCLNTNGCDPSMKKALVHYGLNLTALQQLERMRRALRRDNTPALDDELRNPGHQNWSPHREATDWLLLEIDGDLLIRSEQVDVARAIIAPISGQNSVLQMNMGKGKTSVIVPMVVAALADGKTLARLIVPKALLMATAQVAQARLGGLVGREIRHIPFSRKTKTSPDMLDLYAKLHLDAGKMRGVILTSHEHILSFKLGAWQHLADGKTEEAAQMSKIQLWLDRKSRDVLDECDFTLSVKTQLNYPGGHRTHVDGQPFRWQAAEALLDMVADHVPALRRQHPAGMDVLGLESPASFPMMRFLRREAEDATIKLVVDSICGGSCPFIRPTDSALASPAGAQIQAIRRLLTEEEFCDETFAQAVSAFEDEQTSTQKLLVVRGQLTNKILLTCLGKRWNVQYGLHPLRDPLAVPFEAKGIPSEHAEFGHPDVAIMLTCLAFYYKGLTEPQLLQSLQHVLQSADPAQQYEAWITGSNRLPESLRHWNAINTEDGAQIEELWTHLSHSLVAVNYYLDHFVFPPHAKQFEVKLQASGWDIPLLLNQKMNTARTTGFSGTNDNRTMLPLTIKQDDLPSLRQTSAEVLTYLLQERNRGYRVTVDDFDRNRLNETGLLRRLKEWGIRILIDAGAYILEIDNKTLAQTWLKEDSAAKAAIYFGQDDRAWVHYRDEGKEDSPLLATRFADDLNGCLVYLDEAHTRGVDLKLPADACGALTLALGQTKDFTMQAAMRLRQLRTTQSVVFLAPPDVDQSIRNYCSVPPRIIMDSSHVISWLLEQTCRGLEDLQSLYVSQGVDFCRRTDAEWRYHQDTAEGLGAPEQQRSKLLAVIQKPERQTLERLYGGKGRTESSSLPPNISDARLRAFMDRLAGFNVRHSANLDALQEVEQEQEQEVQVQVEQVSHVQRPARYTPLVFPGLRLEIEQFVRTGVLPRSRGAYEHAFAYVGRTSVGRKFGVRETGSKLFVSAEHGRTVKLASGTGKTDVADNFLRPVKWILWSPSTETALVVIPEEAERIIPILRLTIAAGKPPVHMLSYAAPTTKAMLPFNKFQYYTLPQLPSGHTFPQWFGFEVGILAGRLYVDADEWDALREFVRPTAAELVDQEAKLSTFAHDPATFVREWLALRHPTQNILHTPMGYICMGRSLEQSPWNSVDH
ncbi:hypothetical protein RB598_000014 [Gaeumannomyces tritici]